MSPTLCICAFALECEIFHSISPGIVSPSQAVVVLAVPSQDNSASMSWCHKTLWISNAWASNCQQFFSNKLCPGYRSLHKYDSMVDYGWLCFGNGVLCKTPDTSAERTCGNSFTMSDCVSLNIPRCSPCCDSLTVPWWCSKLSIAAALFAGSPKKPQFSTVSWISSLNISEPFVLMCFAKILVKNLQPPLNRKPSKNEKETAKDLSHIKRLFRKHRCTNSVRNTRPCRFSGKETHKGFQIYFERSSPTCFLSDKYAGDLWHFIWHMLTLPPLTFMISLL